MGTNDIWILSYLIKKQVPTDMNIYQVFVTLYCLCIFDLWFLIALLIFLNFFYLHIMWKYCIKMMSIDKYYT